MTAPLLLRLPYRQRNLLFLEEVLFALRQHGLPSEWLFRASEAEKLERVLAHGTDRAGFGPGQPWKDGPREDLLHEDVIYATTAEEIRLGEADPARSTSLKKFALIERPLLLAYDRAQLHQLADRQHAFRDPGRKLAALRAVIQVDKGPEIEGWFREDAGLRYRALAASVLGGRIVEVGCWKGLSTSYVGRLAAAQGTLLWCVDGWAGSSDGYDGAYRRMLGQEDVQGAFVRNMRELGIPVAVVRQRSPAAAAGFADGSLDLVFLDGSHDEAAVRADLGAFAGKLRRGGLLAGHDHGALHPGVVAAVAGFAAGSGWPLQVDPSGVYWLRAGA